MVGTKQRAGILKPITPTEIFLRVTYIKDVEGNTNINDEGYKNVYIKSWPVELNNASFYKVQ